jgi:recombination protein RecA
MFGNPETTSGGRALKFYASVRIDIRRISSIKEGEETIGNRTKAKVVKNKMAAPFRQAEFDILYGEGISREGDLVDLGLQYKMIDKSGTWFSYGDVRLGQGRENVKQFLKANTDLAAEIEQKLRKTLGLVRPTTEEVAAAAAAAAASTATGPGAAATAAAAGAPAGDSRRSAPPRAPEPPLRPRPKPATP